MDVTWRSDVDEKMKLACSGINFNSISFILFMILSLNSSKRFSYIFFIWIYVISIWIFNGDVLVCNDLLLLGGVKEFIREELYNLLSKRLGCMEILKKILVVRVKVSSVSHKLCSSTNILMPEYPGLRIYSSSIVHINKVCWGNMMNGLNHFLKTNFMTFCLYPQDLLCNTSYMRFYT